MKFSLRNLFGKADIKLEERIFNSVSFLSALFTFYYVFHGLFWGLNNGIQLINVVAFLGFLTMFWLSRTKGLFKKLIFPFICFSLLVMSLSWLFNGGANGGMPFLFALAFVSYIMITDSQRHLFVFLLVLITLGILYLIDFFFPWMIVPHSEEFIRQMDASTANYISLMFIGWLIAILKQNYNKEKETVVQQKSKLEEAYKIKSRFLANMSHEIRTPMNGMLGMASVLANTSLTEQQRDYLHAIEVSGDRLLTIINEVLDYSKLEAGEMKLSQEAILLEQCLDEVLEISAPKAFSKKLELLSWIEEDVPAIIESDYSKLRQILLNIVGNALKFTNEGSVLVKVKKIAQEQNVVMLQFDIQDTGIGIQKKYLSNLFNSFTQVDDSNKREYGGTGLGLAISRDFVKMLGGDIFVESTFGEGSIFGFTIKATIKSASNTLAEAASLLKISQLKGKKVLVVDNNNLSRGLLEKKLQQWGIDVLALPSAKAALNWLSEPDSTVDATIVDYRMPVANGLDLGQKMLEIGFNKPMILMLMHQQVDMAIINKIFGSTIQKPIKNEQLLESLHQTFSTKKAEKKVLSNNNSIIQVNANNALIKVLLVEDDLVNQKLTMSLLGLMGYESAALAKDGQEAIDMVENGGYDVVLMDVQMPKIDGIQATKIIRSMDIQQPIIVAMTANVLDSDQQDCLDAGMDYFIQKPINIPKLKKLLGEIFII